MGLLMPEQRKSKIFLSAMFFRQRRKLRALELGDNPYISSRAGFGQNNEAGLLSKPASFALEMELVPVVVVPR